MQAGTRSSVCDTPCCAQPPATQSVPDLRPLRQGERGGRHFTMVTFDSSHTTIADGGWKALQKVKFPLPEQQMKTFLVYIIISQTNDYLRKGVI